MARLSTALAFGAALMLVTLVLLEGSRLAAQFGLPAVGPVAGLVIVAVEGFISGSLFFSSPARWLVAFDS